MRKDYATELTKEFLKKAGVVDVDFDTLTVYGVNGPLNPIPNKAGYLIINLYDLDENDQKIKVPRIMKYKKQDGTISEYMTYTYKPRTVGLHRLLWAWEYGIVETGYVIDHKNNHHTELKDYVLDNLKKITQAQNLAKDLEGHNSRIVPASPKRTIDYYQKKLDKAIKEYEYAKKIHDPVMAHRKRSLISLQKAKIRYLLQKEGK